MISDTYRKWLVRCDACDKAWEDWEWASKLPLRCRSCDGETYLFDPRFDTSASIIGDEIPGGVVINHLTPTPQRFYSKTDIKKACNEYGFNWADDTPGPYKVRWSGKSKQPERPAPLVKPAE